MIRAGAAAFRWQGNRGEPSIHRFPRPATTIEHMSWWESAACQGMPLELFFGSDRQGMRPVAPPVCWACPVQQQCLEAAIAEEAGQPRRLPRHGIRGGLTPCERGVYAG